MNMRLVITTLLGAISGAVVAATAFAPVVLGGSGSRKEQGDNQKSKCFHKPNKIWFFG